MDFKVFENTDKMQNAYNELIEIIQTTIDKHELCFFEIWGILKVIDVDIIKSNFLEEE